MAGSSAHDVDVEHWLLPVLLLAFGAAAGATLAARPSAIDVPLGAFEHAPPETFPAEPPMKAPAGYLRLTVADVVWSEGASRSAVLLTGMDDRFVLPLFVEADAGQGLQQRLEALSGEEPPPLAQAISAMGGEVLRVELAVGDDGPVAHLVITQDGQEQPLETGLSDALAVAVARGATVWVDQALVDQHAFETSELVAPEGNTASHLRAPARL